jgi:hypothetical protein
MGERVRDRGNLISFPLQLIGENKTMELLEMTVEKLK